ncbi:DoxX family protein [Streptomyces tendae]|uniref:DoxX family protein n=1 Tax=Streptomyces tendae TaxID=1932 RepID=UPI0037A50971
MNLAFIVVAALYGVVLAVSGTGHIADWRLPRTPAASCGFSPAGCRFVGVLELLGGVGLLAATFLTEVAAAAAGGIFLLTSAAFLYQDTYGARGFRWWAPAVTAVAMLCMTVGLPLSAMG